MENISITTLEDFKQILGNIKSSEKVRIYINDGFHIDVLEIVKIYNDLFSRNTFDENLISCCRVFSAAKMLILFPSSCS